jgi:hypothetical protein
VGWHHQRTATFAGPRGVRADRHAGAALAGAVVSQTVMTIDRERERPGVAMDNGRRTTEVVQTGGVNVVLCIEALLARLIGVG